MPASDARPYAGLVWRLVEDQGRPATMRLVDSLEEQALLEAVLEQSKPALPKPGAHLHYLLATPFRYPPSRHGSRFRRPFALHGCFYAAEQVETAAIETGFWQLLFLADAPGLPWPIRALERRAFAAEVATDRALDLTAPPLDARRASWTHPTDYAPCQDFAEEARAAGILALRYESVRDPARRANIALLDCAAFAAPEPQAQQSWWIFPRPHALQAWCEAPRIRIEIPLTDFAADPRIATRLSSPEG
ncbi:MAG: RES family NAD+ phosphorylase [Roseococcus sp.]